MKEIKQLKKLMKANNLSHEFVARKIGIGVRTVFRWTRGESKPTSEPMIMQLKKFIEENK